jgi:hypothetical protein
MNSLNLFSTVPDDMLGFGRGRAFAPKQVTDWLDLKKDEVARIANVSPNSVRYDEDIPQALYDRLEEIASICNLVAGIFNGDAIKTALWFKTKNPLLGDISPRDMVRLGRYDRLRKFIINAIAENAPSARVS